jgi:peptide deformylase
MKVKRAKKVIVEYTDIEGKRKEEKFVNYMSRCFQHELDHLNGITFDQQVSKLVFDRAIKKRRKQYGR